MERVKKEVKIVLPDGVKTIIGRIQEAGYEAYVVGGCVRDSLLGKSPDDWDITTSALPHEIKKIFPKTIDTGIRHGTVTVILSRIGYEVTTYRIDGEYEDGRHPKEVVFTRSLVEDLKRRDFTINAMAYNEEEGLIDEFEGIRDMEQGIIRCVGDAFCRFGEDALRMMRAVRFSAVLGYSIEDKTKEAIKQLAPGLGKVSMERIQVELIKLLKSPHPEYLRIAYDTGLTAVFLPEFDRAMETPQNNPHHCYNVGEHMLNSLTVIEADKVLRLTMLLHDIGKPVTRKTDKEGIDHFYGRGDVGEEMAKEILKRLKMDNDTTNKVCKLVKYHDLKPELQFVAVRRAVVKVGVEIFPLLLEVQQADLLAQSEYKREEKQKKLDRIKEMYEEILAKGNCLTLKELAVTGQDLLNMGMKPGKEVGKLLEQLLWHVLDRPEDNQKEILLKLAEQYRQE